MMNSIRGSTYTPTWNAIRMQKVSTENDEILVTKLKTDKKGVVVEEQEEVCRTWAGSIYNMQVEDGEGYGWRMKAIPQLSLQGAKKAAKKKSSSENAGSKADSSLLKPALRATMLTYVLLCLYGLCKEFYHILENKNDVHSQDNFSGHMLTLKNCYSLLVAT